MGFLDYIEQFATETIAEKIEKVVPVKAVAKEKPIVKKTIIKPKKVSESVEILNRASDILGGLTEGITQPITQKDSKLNDMTNHAADLL